MPPLTVPIPLDALAVGTTSYGPATAADDVSLATITIDRTVTRGNVQGFNGSPATTRAELAVWQSNDGGATWLFRASAGIEGGIIPSNPAGDPAQVSSVTVELLPGTARRVRADVTVTGARVAVAGNLAVV